MKQIAAVATTAVATALVTAGVLLTTQAASQTQPQLVSITATSVAGEKASVVWIYRPGELQVCSASVAAGQEPGKPMCSVRR